MALVALALWPGLAACTPLTFGDPGPGASPDLVATDDLIRVSRMGLGTRTSTPAETEAPAETDDTQSDPDLDDESTSPTDTAAENRKAGKPGWLTVRPVPGASIEGFADAVSVTPGQGVGLAVSTTAKTFTVEVLRTGDYGGTWGRRVWLSPTMPGERRTGSITVKTRP